MLAAVIFDFDGVIADTEPLHWAAFEQVFAPHGLNMSWEEYVRDYIGFDDREVVRNRFTRAGYQPEAELIDVLAAKAKAFVELARRQPPTPYPGVLRLIATIAEALPLGLCSGALRSDLQPILEALGVWDKFDAVVTAEEVPRSKPDPRCYELCIKKLQVLFPDAGIQPGCTVAIEDTPAGIAAATGAGLRVLAVTHTHPSTALQAGAVVSTLEAVSLDQLAGLTA